MDKYQKRSQGTLNKRKDQFISKSQNAHKGANYDYSNVNYVNVFTEVVIVCPTHGAFNIIPKNHTEGSGCPACGRSRLGWNVWGTREERANKFINKSNVKHAFKYDYSRVKYVDGKTKVEIICPKHGSFFQTPDSHMNTGLGCSKCKSSRGESLIRWWLTKFNIPFTEQQTFDGCIHKKPLKFDFYLPNHNLIIECNGKQHYEHAPIFHERNGWNTLEIQQIRDSIKVEYAHRHNIDILIIPYYQYDNIWEILSNKLLPQ